MFSMPHFVGVSTHKKENFFEFAESRFLANFQSTYESGNDKFSVVCNNNADMQRDDFRSIKNPN